MHRTLATIATLEQTARASIKANTVAIANAETALAGLRVSGLKLAEELDALEQEARAHFAETRRMFESDLSDGVARQEAQDGGTLLGGYGERIFTPLPPVNGVASF